MEFQKLLLDAAKALGKDEVRALAFLCTDLLGSRCLTSVEEASELFSRLVDQDLLSPERPHLLAELLLTIQRSALVRDLGLDTRAPATDGLIRPYREMLYWLSENITDADLAQFKFLLRSDLKRRKLEENVSMLEVLLEMERTDLLNETNLNLLERLITAVCPMLNRRISQFKTSQANHVSPAVQEMGRPRSSSYPWQQNQVLPYSVPEARPSCERPGAIESPARLHEFDLSAESSMSSCYTAAGVSDVAAGGEDDCEALASELSGLSAGASSCSLSEVRGDALDALTEEAQTSSPKTTLAKIKFQTTNTNDEGLGTYPMAGPNRGICLIVNNKHFTNGSLKRRNGTEIDEESLSAVFRWLGFQVEVLLDCNREAMLSAIRELSSRDHSAMDCLVCCVLSHGLEGGVHSVDGLSVEFRELMEPFNAARCRSLAGKPKLFFVQACQGTSEQQAVYVEEDGPSLVSSDARKTRSIPSDADFLLGVATVPFCVSYRQSDYGTWFIQSLCQNLIKMVPGGCDLVTILTKVNADVSQKTDSSGTKKQMPQPAFSLRKRVIFPNPKDPPPTLSTN